MKNKKVLMGPVNHNITPLLESEVPTEEIRIFHMVLP